jgi:acyl-coenzyme A thioesterase PaaI-like protein
MPKRVLLFVLSALVGCAVAAQAASAAGLAVPGGAAGGVTVSGSSYRYTALSPGTPGKLTVVARTDRDGGRVSRWWYLRGSYDVPAVAYDGSAGGLSANGVTLVLSRFSQTYPPRTTRFAILNTSLYLRHPRRTGQRRPHHAITHVILRGDFSFDAISPDGSTVYLIHHQLPPRAGAAYTANYEVRALDTRSGELLPQPIVDPDEPDERMQGLPITRATSPDGRWAYTLYDGNGKVPFLHALDTVRRRAVCVDFPQLKGRRNLFLLKLSTEQAGRRLVVRTRPSARGQSRQLLNLDTKSFEVEEPGPTATASTAAISPWLVVGLGTGVLGCGLYWRFRRHRGPRQPKPVEQA